MVRNVILFLCLMAHARAQGLSATWPLQPLPAATFGGRGIPNNRVAMSTFAEGANTITLGLSASGRGASAALADNGTGTYFASPGAGTPATSPLWNFNFYVQSVNTFTGADALPGYRFELLFDQNPESFTGPQELGRLAITTVFQTAATPPGTIENSLHLGLAYLRVPAAGFVTPAPGYADPGGKGFDPSLPGHYTFVLRAYKGVERLGEVVMYVSTLGEVLPNPEYSYQVRYLANLDLGDSIINITNTGSRAADEREGITNSTATGAICANLYAFAPDGQMLSCCSCPVTPNGLVYLSARRDLVNERIISTEAPTSVVLKLVGTIPQAGAAGCSLSPLTVSALTVTPGPGQLSSGLRAWATTVHDGGSRLGLTVTESPFAPATLSISGAGNNVGELRRLTQGCAMIRANGGDYFGICSSCRLGALGAGRL